MYVCVRECRNVETRSRWARQRFLIHIYIVYSCIVKHLCVCACARSVCMEMNFPRAIYLAKRPFCDWPFEFTHHIRRSLNRERLRLNRRFYSASLKYLHVREEWIANVVWMDGEFVYSIGKTIYYTLITDTNTHTHTHFYTKKKRCARSPNERLNERSEWANERMNVIQHLLK